MGILGVMRAPSVKDRIGVRNHKLRLPEELAFGITVESSGEATLDTAGISDHRITKIGDPRQSGTAFQP